MQTIISGQINGGRAFKRLAVDLQTKENVMTQQTNADYAAFVLRVTSGALFIAHGLLKV